MGAVTRDRAGPCKAPEHREASPHAAANRRLGFCAPVHGDSRARPAGTAGRYPCPGPAPRPPSASPARWNGRGENTQGSAPITRLGSAPDPTGFPPAVNGEGPCVPPRLNPGERRGSPVPPAPLNPLSRCWGRRPVPCLLQGPATGMLALKEIASLSPSFSPLLEGPLLLTGTA